MRFANEGGMNIKDFDCQNKAGNESKTRNGVTMKTYKEQYGKRVRFIIAQLAGLFLLPLVAVAAAPTLTTYYWASNETSLVSGPFNEPANWLDSSLQPAGTVPGALSLASFYHLPKEEYTVTLPQGVYTNYASLMIYSRKGKAVTIDGRGSVFVSPTTATDNYSNRRIRFSTSVDTVADDAKSNFYIDDGGAEDYTSGYSLSNVVWRFKARWNNSASIESIEFKQGLFNFYDFDGIPHPFRLYTYSAPPNNSTQPITLTFYSGSSLRIYDFYPVWQFGGGNTFVNFYGGEHHIFGNFNLFKNKTSSYTEAAPNFTDVHVVGDAAVRANVLKVWHGTGAQAYGPNQRTLVAVENGGTLTATGGVNWATFNEQRLYVTNGAYCAFGPVDGSAVRPINNFANSAIQQGIGTNIVAVVVDNSRFDMTGDNRIGNVDISLRDSTFNLAGLASLGYSAGRSTHVSATNSTVSVNLDSSQVLYVGSSGTGVVELVDSDLTLAASRTLSLGNDLNSRGEFILDGGSFARDMSVRDGNLVRVGDKGSGLLTVKGGSFEAYSMYVHYGNSGTSNPTCIVHQTGGTIKITAGSFSDSIENPWYACRIGQHTSAGVTKLVLDGGEFHAARLYATYSALNSPSTGCHTYFEADGGTIVGLTPPSTANNVVTLRNFEKASLGAKGLTISTSGETRTEQDFCDKDGSEGSGRLLLTGTGVKKLYGTNSTESLLVCVNGKTQFLPLSGVNACHLSHLIVTNNATFSIAGAQDGARFKAVTLADAMSGGTFEMDSADRVTVDGAMVIGGAMTLSLADAAPLGTHPLFTAAGEASPATKENWAAARIVGAAHNGLVYTLSADYDSAADKTAFNLVVTAGGPLEGEVAYQDDGSWDGTKLVKFTDASPATVSVGSSAAGAVRFDAAKNFTLSGTGPLTFSDSGGYAVMETVRGVQTVETPVNVPRDMRITVASGATNAITGAIAGGGIVKDGRGTAQLANAANYIPNGVTVESGLLSASDADALGGAPVTLAGGTLEIKSAGMLDTPLEISTCAAATAAVVKIEADISMPAPSVTQGAFIKRGAGRLTLTSGKNVFVCGQYSGTLANINNSYVHSTTTFDGEGGYSVSGQYAFGGLNVAEGELVLRGTAEDVTFLAPAYVCVGIGTSQGTANPGLVVDHATLNCSGNRFAFANTYGSTFAVEPYLIATNKATISGSFTCGWGATTANLSAKMLLDDSVQFSGYMFYPMRGTRRADYLYRNGSALYVTGGVTADILFDNGPATLTFTNSVLASKTSLDSGAILPVKIASESSSTSHEIRLRDGSTLYSNWLTNKYATAETALTVGFDNSEWKPIRSDETGDFTFDFPPYETVRFEMEGRGVIMSPAAEKTFTVVSPFVGDGGMRKRGAGTLAFACKSGMRSWDFGGTLSIEEGAVTLAAGAVREGAKAEIADGAALDLNGTTLERAVISGEGTVANGTLDSSRIMVDVTNAGVVTGSVKLSNVAFTGRTVIDLGRTQANPLPDRTLAVTLFSYSGSAPDVSGWRLKGTGRGNVKGRFEAAGGIVTCTISATGFVFTCY